MKGKATRGPARQGQYGQHRLGRHSLSLQGERRVHGGGRLCKPGPPEKAEGQGHVKSDIQGEQQEIQNPLKGRACLCRAEIRSEEHTSELQSLMRISYAVFCL